ncbi:uncharacterized protein F4807DRAFT_20038 [Annulohypoxylon truncatum]|uniref:uncharacterized protein n=1 Tax=Annulohypoxylon truncatum TaxID=327061 RepID=UPI002008E09C|nr:uncharacterized protein F4807DRAFT_20038 [Annulohypoxylon truncatum]KAI1215076.1 hypothetical protein F4807DRAFT_20038 [Annulohypoxylon truncatum]
MASDPQLLLCQCLCFPSLTRLPCIYLYKPVGDGAERAHSVRLRPKFTPALWRPSPVTITETSYAMMPDVSRCQLFVSRWLETNLFHEDGLAWNERALACLHNSESWQLSQDLVTFAVCLPIHVPIPLKLRSSLEILLGAGVGRCFMNLVRLSRTASERNQSYRAIFVLILARTLVVAQPASPDETTAAILAAEPSHAATLKACSVLVPTEPPYNSLAKSASKLFEVYSRFRVVQRQKSSTGISPDPSHISRHPYSLSTLFPTSKYLLSVSLSTPILIYTSFICGSF